MANAPDAPGCGREPCIDNGLIEFPGQASPRDSGSVGPVAFPFDFPSHFGACSTRTEFVRRLESSNDGHTQPQLRQSPSERFGIPVHRDLPSDASPLPFLIELAEATSQEHHEEKHATVPFACQIPSGCLVPDTTIWYPDSRGDKAGQSHELRPALIPTHVESDDEVGDGGSDSDDSMPDLIDCGLCDPINTTSNLLYNGSDIRYPVPCYVVDDPPEFDDDISGLEEFLLPIDVAVNDGIPHDDDTDDDMPPLEPYDENTIPLLVDDDIDDNLELLEDLLVEDHYQAHGQVVDKGTGQPVKPTR